MALDNFRTIELIWDKANKSIIKTIKTASSDTTGRYLSVKVLDGGQETTLNGAKLQLYWEHPNFNTSGTDDFNTVNNGGLFNMTFSDEMLTNIGELNAHLILTLSDGKITSDGFSIKVFKGADDGVVVPTNSGGLVKKIEGKIDKGNVTLSDLTQEVKLALTGGAVAIVGADAVDTENIKDSAVTNEKLQNDSVTFDKINSRNTNSNILNINALTNPFYFGEVGSQATLKYTSNWRGTPETIPVKTGDIVRFNKALQDPYFVGVDENNIVRQLGAVMSTAGYKEVVVDSGVVGFYTATHSTVINEAMITINEQMPSSYVPYGESKLNLAWLDVSLKNLDENLISELGKKQGSNYAGKTMISAGDSITWQDGKVYTGTSNIARGWQTHVKEQLGLESVRNIAVSGRSMADGTTNGVGTVTTVLLETDFPEDLFVIAAGTNDFKLNVPIGVLNNIGGTFDRNTFYGAYQTTIEYILSKSKDIRIVLFTPLHRNNGGYNSTTTVNSAGHKLTDYVEAIKEIGSIYSSPVCDMYANSGINMLTLGVDARDGLHPNDVGYDKMGNYATKFINNV